MAARNGTRRLTDINEWKDKIFERLTVVSVAVNAEGQTGTRWVCRCECGEFRTIVAKSVVYGLATSCGCLMREKTVQMGRCNREHGLSKTREYAAWNAMMQRCYNPGQDCYAEYGGRGITVCDRWKDSFEAFLEDMGPKPSPRHTVERIDNDKGYSPENCEWATRKTQARNRRNTVLLEFRGQQKTVNGWCEALNLPLCTMRARLRYGWSAEKAFTTPVATKFGRKRSDARAALGIPDPEADDAALGEGAKSDG